MKNHERIMKRADQGVCCLANHINDDTSLSIEYVEMVLLIF